MTARIEPATTAILGMDFQPGLLGFLADPAPLIDRVGSAIDLVRSRGGSVGYVRVGFTEGDYAAFPDGSMMGNRVKGGRPNLDADAPSAGFHPSLDVRPRDLTVRKTRVGAFSTTDLHNTLVASGVQTVILAGVHTSGVVLTTVREAHDLDYTVVVLADACADPEPEVHEFLMNRIFPKQAVVITTAELRDTLG